MIIGLMAKKRSGKDTIADYLIKEYGFERYGFADPIKVGVGEMFDFNHEQLYGDLKEVVDDRWGVSPREVLQAFGTELSQFDLPRHLPALAPIGRAIWVHRFKIWYESRPEKNIVLSDCRFLHEVDAIRKMGGQIWKIIRPGYDTSADMHASEKELEMASFDHLILNDGTLNDLYVEVSKLML